MIQVYIKILIVINQKSEKCTPILQITLQYYILAILVLILTYIQSLTHSQDSDGLPFFIVARYFLNHKNSAIN